MYIYVYVCVLGEGERFIFSIFVLGLFSANIKTKLHQPVIHGDIFLWTCVNVAHCKCETF